MKFNYTEEQLAAIRAEYAAGANDNQFTNFMRECEERELIPGRQVYLQIREVDEWDDTLKIKVRVKKATRITSIDSLRVIAERSGQYRGRMPVKWIYLNSNHEPNIHSLVPLPENSCNTLWAAQVTVLREKFEPLTAVARFDAYAVNYKGKDGKPYLNSMWKKRGPEQLAKCANALALREAFPELLGGLYLADELRDDDPKPETNTDSQNGLSIAPALAVPSVMVPTVNHTPSEGKDLPRPNHDEAKPEASVAMAPASPIVVPLEPEPSKIEKAEFSPPILPSPAQKKEYNAAIRLLCDMVDKLLGVTNGRELIKAYVLKQTGCEVKNLTLGQWVQVLHELQTATDKGEIALRSLLLPQQYTSEGEENASNE